MFYRRFLVLAGAAFFIFSNGAAAAPSTAKKAKCPAYMVDSLTGNYEKIGKAYRCFNSPREAERKDYWEELLCAGGQFETLSELQLSGNSPTEMNSKVFTVKGVSKVVEYFFIGDGRLNVELINYETGKGSKIVTANDESSGSSYISEAGRYYLRVVVDAGKGDEAEPPEWQVNIYDDWF